MLSSSSGKRTRTNEEDEDDDEKNTPSSFIDQMLKLDTDQLLASEGRNNAETLLKLQEFCTRLQASIDTVKKEQFDEEEKKTEDQVRKTNEEKVKEDEKRNEEAIDCRFASDTYGSDDDSDNEEKMKERMTYISDKLCFECKKSVEDLSALSPCCGYNFSGVSGDGILVCNDCKVKFYKSTCPECNNFLCNRESCVEICGHDSRNCASCEKITCLYCVATSSTPRKTCNKCYEWYCPICTDDKIYLERCEGSCNELLCNKCVQNLACGNNVRLCGTCEFECDDCDMCEGRWGGNHSRWN